MRYVVNTGQEVPIEDRTGAPLHYRSLSAIVRELNYARARALEARGDTEGARLARRAAKDLSNRTIRRRSGGYWGDR